MNSLSYANGCYRYFLGTLRNLFGPCLFERLRIFGLLAFRMSKNQMTIKEILKANDPKVTKSSNNGKGLISSCTFRFRFRYYCLQEVRAGPTQHAGTQSILHGFMSAQSHKASYFH
jgi:hypothetical protein